jgi:O-antigen biosynthesis protein WbqP
VKSFFDFVISFLSLLLLLPVVIFLAIMVKFSSHGPALHWSKRVGRRNVVFLMPKFRTMRVDTPQLATHLLTSPDAYITPVGKFLRRTSLDELPQLWSILKGDMSFVGPRPALFNQDDLVALRTSVGVDALLPGLTGWAQVNGRDELSITRKVEFDVEYLKRRSLAFDIKIMVMTFLKAFRSEGVAH